MKVQDQSIGKIEDYFYLTLRDQLYLIINLFGSEEKVNVKSGDEIFLLNNSLKINLIVDNIVLVDAKSNRESPKISFGVKWNREKIEDLRGKDICKSNECAPLNL
jgi:hypothetical protein